MKCSLTCVLVVFAMASTMAATRRPKYSKSAAAWSRRGCGRARLLQRSSVRFACC